ncbi:MAG: tripartite tricarboxylate transporter permease [Firmicutes bacterium]|nr:tripartite tricarboxylate transporter permease [Bacillota bacterium]
MPWMAGLALIVQPVNLFAMVFGSAVGLFIGTLPGLGPAFALTLFLPLTFPLPTVPALTFLVSMYTAAVYGGAISAILINVPGHPGNIATTFDGFPMARQGRAGEAIAAVGVAGAVGGILSVIVLTVVAPLVVDIAVKISPADYFMLAVFGLSMVSATAGRHVIEGLLLGGLGFLFSTVGEDPITGSYRFTYGSQYLLSNGISFSVVVVGLFALGSAFLMLEERHLPKPMETARIRHDFWVGVRQALTHPVEVLRSSVVGVIMGVVPGLGIAISNIAAYLVESRWRPNAGWGEGNVVGVMAPEAADNATLIAELIPAFTLGIPGAATSALMLDAITVHGLQPGPSFFSGGAEVTAFFLAMGLSQIVFAILGILFARFFAKGAEVPTTVLAPIIIVMGCVGAYAIHGAIGDIVLALIFGGVGYIILKMRWPLAPMVLGTILGPLAEDNYRRALLIAQTTHQSPFLSPLPIALGILSIAVFVFPLIGQVRDWRARLRETATP